MENKHELIMVHDNIAEAPCYPAKPPVTLETYKKGYEAHWLAIHLDSDKLNTFTGQTFKQEFQNFEDELNKRQIYASIDGHIIGTCTAWNDIEGDYTEYGRVHWLAVSPAFQNQGLAKILLSKTIEILREWGYKKAFLVTDIRRADAIHLYENFGFKKIETKNS